MAAPHHKRKGIMLAYPFEEKRLAKWQPPYLVQPKLDGERCRAVPYTSWETGETRYVLLSSEENLILSVPHINKELNKLTDKVELDGELYIHGMPFEDIHSIVGRTKNIHPDHERIMFHIFDVIDEGMAQRDRTMRLMAVLSRPRPPLKMVEVFHCTDMEDIAEIYRYVCDRGYEGIIVRNVWAPYVRKRSTSMMKFKPKKSDTYRIVGTVEEMDKHGNPKGRLGAIVCVSNNDVFSVGTGLTDSDRSKLWEARATLPGRYCVVEYQHLTSGRNVPRFPVFVEVIDPPAGELK